MEIFRTCKAKGVGAESGGLREGPGPFLALPSHLSSARSKEWTSLHPRHSNRPWVLAWREDGERCWAVEVRRAPWRRQRRERREKGHVSCEPSSLGPAALAMKTCHARGSSAQGCQAGPRPLIPSAPPKAAWVAGPVLGPGDTDESGAVCPQGPPQTAGQARD